MLEFRDTLEKKRLRWLPILILLIGLAGGIGLAVLLYQGASQPEPEQVFSVTLEGNAMEPTLLKGSTAKFEPRAVYQRGDIIWLNDPTNGPRQRHVRRVVGVAGDTVQLTNGTLYVNNAAVAETYITQSQPPVPNFGPVQVGTGQLFVLSDNRSISQDSRQWGSIETKLVRGALIK